MARTVHCVADTQRGISSQSEFSRLRLAEREYGSSSYTVPLVSVAAHELVARLTCF
jgi:hypothetical protein